MRIVVILLLLSLGLAVGAAYFHQRQKDVSQVLLGFSVLFGLMLAAAFFNLL